MKKTIFLLFVCSLLKINCYSNIYDNIEKYTQLKNLVDNTQKKYAPDKRVVLFDITISDNNGIPVLHGATNNTEAYDELLKEARKINSLLVDSIDVLPAADLKGETYGIINVSVADIRVDGDFEYEMATQATLGTPVKILQKKGRWSRVQTPDGYIAWTHNMSVTPMTKNEFNSWTNAPKIIFTDYFGFTYQTTDKEGRRVSDIVNGNILKYEGEENSFYKVSYPDGRIAYIDKQQAQPFDNWLSSVQLTDQSIINHAFTLMGIPYTWGGTSVKGMDCSGFTKTVLFMHGIVLMRDASQQVHTGIPVDISNRANLQPGDLMFFGKKAENGKKERIRHVGFYIGDNKFIHASGYIRVSSLDLADSDYDELNAREFVRASRIIGAVGREGIWKITDNPFYQTQE